MIQYPADEIMALSRKLVEENDVISLIDLITLLPISKQTFYDKIKFGSDEFDEIKGLINKNKVRIKQSLRKKWTNSDNATTQIVLYKLCSTREELDKINGKERVTASELPEIKVTLER